MMESTEEDSKIEVTSTTTALVTMADDLRASQKSHTCCSKSDQLHLIRSLQRFVTTSLSVIVVSSLSLAYAASTQGTGTIASPTISTSSAQFAAPVSSSASSPFTSDLGCGINRFNNESPLTERIVGGNNSLHGEWPWQVSVRLNHPQAGKVGHWCGGTLINKEWIVTAAHCIINPLFTLPQAMFWEVRLGEHNQKNTEDEEKTLSISHVFHYPWYRGYDNDIAVMKLTEPVKVTEYVRPICVPQANTSFFGKECVATGWGKVDYNKKASNILQKVGVDVYEISECQNAYYPKFRISIDQWHLCAGTRDGGRGTCHGDSGGPLQCRVNGKWMIAGITSFGSGCAKPGFPDVFTNVAYFTNWIKEVMKSASNGSTSSIAGSGSSLNNASGGQPL